jgi:hypothetical protein
MVTTSHFSSVKSKIYPLLGVPILTNLGSRHLVNANLRFCTPRKFSNLGFLLLYPELLDTRSQQNAEEKSYKIAD